MNVDFASFVNHPSFLEMSLQEHTSVIEQIRYNFRYICTDTSYGCEKVTEKGKSLREQQAKGQETIIVDTHKFLAWLVC
jgi:hypothetical protein